MEDLNKYTTTELLKIINDTSIEHNKIKEETINLTFELDKIEKEINNKLLILTTIEKKYVELIEEYSKR